MTEDRPLNLLLVDDEVEFSSTLADRLMLRGFSTSLAADGETALARIEDEAEDHFDLVLLDLILPRMHGLDVLRRIKEVRPGLPVVLLTGQAGAKDGIEGMKRGARGYLSKPIALQELLDILTEVRTDRGALHA